MKPKKPKIVLPEPDEVLESPESVEMRVEDSLSTVIQLQTEITALQQELLPSIKKQVEDTKEFIKTIARDHFNEREERILRNLHEYLASNILWETTFLPGVLKNRQDIEALYRQGYRYLGGAYDSNAKTAGTIYHRAKVPKSYDEFKKLYEKFIAAPVLKQKVASVEEKPIPEAEKKAETPEKKKLVVKTAKK